MRCRAGVSRAPPPGLNSRASRAGTMVRGSRCAPARSLCRPGSAVADAVARCGWAPRDAFTGLSPARASRMQRGIRWCGSRAQCRASHEPAVHGPSFPAAAPHGCCPRSAFTVAAWRRCRPRRFESANRIDMVRARITLSARATCVSTKSASRARKSHARRVILSCCGMRDAVVCRRERRRMHSSKTRAVRVGTRTAPAKMMCRRCSSRRAAALSADRKSGGTADPRLVSRVRRAASPGAARRRCRRRAGG